MTLGPGRPLALDPAVELGESGKLEPVQKGTGGELSGALEPSALALRLEVPEIALHEIRIEPEIASAEYGVLGAKIAPQGVDGLGQRSTSPLLVAVGPEQRRQAVAALRALAGGREQCEQSEPAGLNRPRREGDAVTQHGEMTKADDTEHGGRLRAECIPYPDAPLPTYSGGGMTQRDVMLRWIEQIARVVRRMLQGPGPPDLVAARLAVEDAITQLLGPLALLVPRLEVESAVALLHDPERILGLALLLDLEASVAEAHGEAVAAASTRERAAAFRAAAESTEQ